MYVKALQEHGSHRATAEALGLSKTQFMHAIQKERGLCQRSTNCQNPPEPGKTGCAECLAKVASSRDPEKHKAVQKRLKAKHRERYRKYERNGRLNYNAKNPDYYTNYLKSPHGKAMNNEKRARRRAQKMNATPPWVDVKVLKLFYKNCPEGYDVDHIYPLTHPTCSGLHVIANLQYLPCKANYAKANLLPEEWEAYKASIPPEHLKFLMTPGKHHKPKKPK